MQLFCDQSLDAHQGGCALSMPSSLSSRAMQLFCDQSLDAHQGGCALSMPSSLSSRSSYCCAPLAGAIGSIERQQVVQVEAFEEFLHGQPIVVRHHPPVGGLALLEPIKVVHQFPLVLLRIHPRGSPRAGDSGGQRGIRRDAEVGAVLDDGVAGGVQVQAALRGGVHADLPRPEDERAVVALGEVDRARARHGEDGAVAQVP
eukprot:CAMPEP_0184404174 /NCGR_PEP_ID=MMETSP0007-20130409/85801_1 /TAXON_ID=97485 /ORGANISM="Prymnesium parvum, Strain Texoma1" /LENGTH=201 /DNA_ID=CAMNT_0026760315 /DNA_START=358 /DNA_END=961 /DNA_ORIENTATION=-